jgi:hypothetical protein
MARRVSTHCRRDGWRPFRDAPKFDAEPASVRRVETMFGVREVTAPSQELSRPEGQSGLARRLQLPGPAVYSGR